MIILERANNSNVNKIIETLFFHFPKLKDKVFIKPNWGGRLPIIQGENTDPLFLKGLTEALDRRGVKKIYIGHYPLLKIGDGDYSFDNLLRITGVDRIKFPKCVEFLDLEKVEKEYVSAEEFDFHLPKIIKDVFYIDLAKLKTHVETKVSLCMKNQMGVLPTQDKIAMHVKGLEKGIALLASKLKPDLCIIDGIISMDKNGPHHGRTRKTNILLYSDNLLEVDYLASYLMGYVPKEIKHINVAIDLGVGKIPQDDIIKKYGRFKLRNFILPKECVNKLGLTVWPTTACSQCIFNLARTQGYMKRSPRLLCKILFSKKDYFNIVIGKGDNLRNRQLTNIIAVGECTKNIAKDKNIPYLKGCPPTAEDMYKFIKKSMTG
jgi:uncharacterized protein (DUF362 family)